MVEYLLGKVNGVNERKVLVPVLVGSGHAVDLSNYHFGAKRCVVGAGHDVLGDAVNVGVFNGFAVWVEQCVPGVDGVEVAVGAPGSKFNNAGIALVRAGGFGGRDQAMC